MGENDRLRLRDNLLSWAGASGCARETHRVLGRDQIAELAAGGLIEIGCHTITHPQLSALGLEWQREEIGGSKHNLEETIGRPVTGFAYPYGRDCDYTAETVALVQEAGFEYSCTTSVGVVERGADRFQLPRIPIQDIDGESLDRLLSERLRQ
jgi:peptidoglycan/xylan/chitin deacetylase (PgdA/CDA1 family)